jgi:hypothetical protein
MTELTPSADVQPARFPNLLQRMAGVIFSPRATYQAIAKRPVILGPMAVVLVLSGGGAYWLMNSETGQRMLTAGFEQQMRDDEANGRTISPEERQRTRMIIQVIGKVSAVAAVVVIPVLIAILAAILMAVLNALYGGEASYRHVYSVVTHSWFIFGITGLVTTPLMVAKQEVSSPSTVAALLPMLPADSFVTHFLGAIDFVWIWVLTNLAIGLAVLYKRRTGPLATSLLVTYGVIALVIATARSVF